MSKRLTTDEFINRSNLLHNYKYNYSLVNYTKNSVKVEIICPIHGKFLQRPSSHLLGKGCKKCAMVDLLKIHTLTLDEFIKKAILKHKNKYKYDLVHYKNNRTKVDIICSEHGSFKQTPDDHLSGKGCKKCHLKKITSNTDSFIIKAVKVHNGKYNYSLVQYSNVSTKISIICNICGSTFLQKPNSHLNGQGCPICNRVCGYNKSKWINSCKKDKKRTPKIYILRCYNNYEEFIKIGITKNPMSKRFSCKIAMPYSYEIIKEIKGSPDFVWEQEKMLHKMYKTFSYTPNISFFGKTECFNISILQDILKH